MILRSQAGRVAPAQDLGALLLGKQVRRRSSFRQSRTPGRG